MQCGLGSSCTTFNWGGYNHLADLQAPASILATEVADQHPQKAFSGKWGVLLPWFHQSAGWAGASHTFSMSRSVLLGSIYIYKSTEKRRSDEAMDRRCARHPRGGGGILGKDVASGRKGWIRLCLQPQGQSSYPAEVRKWKFSPFCSAKGVVKFGVKFWWNFPRYVFQGLGVRRKISPKFHVKNGGENGKFHANFTLLRRSADQGSGRGPENGKITKSGEERVQKVFRAQGAKSVLHLKWAPVQNGFRLVQKALGRLWLAGPQNAPSPNHFWEFTIFGPSPRTFGLQGCV